jgi:hypothetical protein
MINRVNFASQYYSNKKLGFKATPKEVADQFKRVDLQEPADVVDFNIDTIKETAATLRGAAQLLKKEYPYHSKFLFDRASKTDD